VRSERLDRLDHLHDFSDGNRLLSFRRKELNEIVLSVATPIEAAFGQILVEGNVEMNFSLTIVVYLNDAPPIQATRTLNIRQIR
jgi:hypothetical protein